MFDVNKMLRREMEFPELFTTKLVTEYGIIFYNPANPLSHDSNHALILDISNPESSIHDIISFYRTRKLVPRLYNAFVDHELDILKPHLESHGFTIESHSDIFLYSPPLAKPVVDQTGDFRKITVISNDVIELFHSDGEGDWGINAVKTAVKAKQFHLLGLFQEEKCVSLASLSIMDGYSRVDDVKTHLNYRGRHLGTRLIQYLVNYHTALSDNYLCLWADNPFAIRLYKNIGFQEIFVDKPRWSAHQPD